MVGRPGSPDIYPPNLGKVNLSSGLALATSLSQQLVLLPLITTYPFSAAELTRCSVHPQLQRGFIIYTHQGWAGSPCLEEWIVLLDPKNLCSPKEPASGTASSCS